MFVKLVILLEYITVNMISSHNWILLYFQSTNENLELKMTGLAFTLFRRLMCNSDSKVDNVDERT